MKSHFIRFIVVILLLFPSALVFAQTLPQLEGKWKIVSASDKEISFNFKTDSLRFAPGLRLGADSAKIASMSLILFNMIRDYVYVFGNGGSFESLHNGITDGKGTYTIKTKDSLLTTTVNRNNLKVTEQMKFYLKDKHLYISHLDEDFQVTMVFEKVTGKKD